MSSAKIHSNASMTQVVIHMADWTLSPWKVWREYGGIIQRSSSGSASGHLALNMARMPTRLLQRMADRRAKNSSLRSPGKI